MKFKSLKKEMKNNLYQHAFFVLFISLCLITSIGLHSYNVESLLLKSKNKVQIDYNSFEELSKNVLVKTFLLNKWISIPEIYEMTYKELRHTMIFELQKRSSILQDNLQELSDNDLASASLMYRFLENSKLKSLDQLKIMTLSGLREAIILDNAEHTKQSIPTLEKLSNNDNLYIAYSYWLPISYASVINNLIHVDAHEAHFKLKDNNKQSTEVLRIVKVDETDFKYLGVYHTMVSENHFRLSLGGSNDLKSWTFISSLGDRSHQGDIKKWGSGYLLVNEEDKTEGTNNIRVRFYASYNDLCKNIHQKSISLPRYFSKYAEGTPDIREVIGGSPDDSYLLIGFHYFNNGDVDYQAMGVLKNFKHWKAWKDDISNRNIIKMGFHGNIGARSGFTHSGNSYVLQEAQIEKYDFSKWRLLIGDGAFYTQLNLQTPNGSKSFANSGITKIDDEKFVVTSFLPSEGNQRQESGQLLYISEIKTKP
jgi:hypothetical protein